MSTHPLREFLADGPDPRRFHNQAALVDAISAAVQMAASRRRMRNPEVLDALLMATASFVQSVAPVGEWNDIGAILADELRARLQVTGDSGEGDYVRKWV